MALSSEETPLLPPQRAAPPAAADKERSVPAPLIELKPPPLRLQPAPAAQKSKTAAAKLKPAPEVVRLKPPPVELTPPPEAARLEPPPMLLVPPEQSAAGQAVASNPPDLQPVADLLEPAPPLFESAPLPPADDLLLPLEPPSMPPAAVTPPPVPDNSATGHIEAEPAAKAKPDITPARRRTHWLLPLLMLLLLLLVMGAALYYLWHYRAHGSEERSLNSAVVALTAKVRSLLPGSWPQRQSTPAATAEPTAANSSSLLKRPIAKTLAVLKMVDERQAADLPAPDASRTNLVAEPAATPPSASPWQRPPPPGQPAVTPGSKEPPRRATATPPAQPVATVVWPELEITAIVGGGARGSALINGRMLTVGEENEDGVKVVKIEQQQLLLEYCGLRRYFTTTANARFMGER